MGCEGAAGRRNELAFGPARHWIWVTGSGASIGSDEVRNLMEDESPQGGSKLGLRKTLECSGGGRFDDRRGKRKRGGESPAFEPVLLGEGERSGEHRPDPC